MTLTINNKEMPRWLYDNINHTCPYCSFSLVDDGPNGQYTQRWCSNPACPGHLSNRMVILAKRLGVKGVGFHTALTFVQQHHLNNHLQILPIWFPSFKPTVDLWEVGDLAMVYGFSGSWKELTLGKSSFQDFFETASDIPTILMQNRNYLLYCEGFFNVKPALSAKVVYIMMTGSIQGYSNRGDFIRALNSYYGSYIQVIDVGKRVRGVSFLIKEDYTVDHSKSDLARRNNIPIVTPRQFVAYIIMEVSKIEHQGV